MLKLGINGADMRINVITYIAVLSVLSFNSAKAEADTFSGNYYYKSCRDVSWSTVPKTMLDAMQTGDCIGAIKSLMYFTNVMAKGLICVPDTATTSQIAKVVTAYMDNNPDIMHENFIKLSIMAVGEAWACNAKQ